MKIEELIVQYLYLNKQVTLQGIGTFKLDPGVILPAGNEKEKDFVMPENAFQFDYNLKAGEDEGLVKYIVQHTRKILPLASSDLESYSMLAKQFLNIGKPLVIEGVGTVQKNQQGNYQFIPGVFITPKIDDIPKQIREKRDESVSFESEGRVNNSRRNLVVAVTIMAIILAGLGIYYLWMKEKTVGSDPVVQTSAVTDTTRQDTIANQVGNTLSQMSDSANTKNTDSFRIVIKKYFSPKTAEKELKRLQESGHNLRLLRDDSLTYQIAMAFQAPLSDTVRTRDSLQQIFGGFPFVKL
ncbi:MAG: hypothetical protein WKI04_11265 [Ferruginibacter sp.]